MWVFLRQKCILRRQRRSLWVFVADPCYKAHMANSIILSLAALIALVPAAVLPLRREASGPDALFWAAVAVAVAGQGAAETLAAARRHHQGHRFSHGFRSPAISGRA